MCEISKPKIKEQLFNDVWVKAIDDVVKNKPTMILFVAKYLNFL